MNQSALDRTARSARAILLAVSLLTAGWTPSLEASQAQSPGATATTGTPPTAPVTPSATPPAEVPAVTDGTDGYSYHPEGRRDPFLSLTGQTGDMSSTTRAPGLAGSLISEMSVKGIVQTQGALVAMLQGPDKKTYIVRGNDRLLDGSIKEIVADAVVFVQDIADPLSLVKQREIRKPLRPMEDEK